MLSRDVSKSVRTSSRVTFLGTVSLGLLASPIIGIVVAAAALGAPLEVYVWRAVFLVIGGVALGTAASSWRR